MLVAVSVRQICRPSTYDIDISSKQFPIASLDRAALAFDQVSAYIRVLNHAATRGAMVGYAMQAWKRGQNPKPERLRSCA